MTLRYPHKHRKAAGDIPLSGLIAKLFGASWLRPWQLRDVVKAVSRLPHVANAGLCQLIGWHPGYTHADPIAVVVFTTSERGGG